MIQISETATILLMLGFAMFLGLILTRAVRNFGIPAVTAYLVAGLLIGPSLIGRLGIGFRTFEDVEGFGILSGRLNLWKQKDLTENSVLSLR